MTYPLLRSTALALLLAYGSIAQAAPKAKPTPKATTSKSAPAKSSSKEKSSSKDTSKDKSKTKSEPHGKTSKEKPKASDNSRNAKKSDNKKPEPKKADNKKPETKKTEPQKRESKKEPRKSSNDEIGSIIQRSTPPATAQNHSSHDAIGSIIQQKQQQQAQATPPVAAREEPSNAEPMGRGDADELISNAMGFIGVAYRFGGTSPTGFDCSGFMQYVFRKAFAVNLPRTSAAQASVGSYVSRSELRPGDMVFFRTHGSRISHVGMYIGNDRFIHAPRTGKRIEITSLSSKYWNARYATARRVKRNNAQNYIRN